MFAQAMFDGGFIVIKQKILFTEMVYFVFKYNFNFKIQCIYLKLRQLYNIKQCILNAKKYTVYFKN